MKKFKIYLCLLMALVISGQVSAFNMNDEVKNRLMVDDMVILQVERSPDYYAAANNISGCVYKLDVSNAAFDPGYVCKSGGRTIFVIPSALLN